MITGQQDVNCSCKPLAVTLCCHQYGFTRVIGLFWAGDKFQLHIYEYYNHLCKAVLPFTGHDKALMMINDTGWNSEQQQATAVCAKVHNLLMLHVFEVNLKGNRPELKLTRSCLSSRAALKFSSDYWHTLNHPNSSEERKAFRWRNHWAKVKGKFIYSIWVQWPFPNAFVLNQWPELPPPWVQHWGSFKVYSITMIDNWPLNVHCSDAVPDMSVTLKLTDILFSQ